MNTLVSVWPSVGKLHGDQITKVGIMEHTLSPHSSLKPIRKGFTIIMYSVDDHFKSIQEK